MNANHVLDDVAGIGGSLLASGDRLVLTVPDKSLITDRLRESIRAKKPELLLLACAHSKACDHTTEDLMRQFQMTGKIRVQANGSVVYLIRSREESMQVDGTVYTLDEWNQLSNLPPHQIRTIHRLRTIGGPGGDLQIRPWHGANAADALRPQ